MPAFFTLQILWGRQINIEIIITEFYLQSTLTLILFETVGGTPFDAMHKYAPMSNREIRDISNESPSHSLTAESK